MCVTANATGCGFDPHSRIWIIIYYFFHLPGQLNMQCHEKFGESGEQSVLTLSFLCLPCCVSLEHNRMVRINAQAKITNIDVRHNMWFRLLILVPVKRHFKIYFTIKYSVLLYTCHQYCKISFDRIYKVWPLLKYDLFL